jgi:hypothetical protein
MGSSTLHKIVGGKGMFLCFYVFWKQACGQGLRSSYWILNIRCWFRPSHSFPFHLKKQQLVLAGKKSHMCPVPIPFGHPTDQPTNTTTHRPTNPPIASFNSRALNRTSTPDQLLFFSHTFLVKLAYIPHYVLETQTWCLLKDNLLAPDSKQMFRSSSLGYWQRGKSLIW